MCSIPINPRSALAAFRSSNTNSHPDPEFCWSTIGSNWELLHLQCYCRKTFSCMSLISRTQSATTNPQIRIIISDNSRTITLIPLVGIFQAEKYCTTRSIIIIIHTRDNIFNVVRPNCLHPRTREKIHYKHRDYKEYKIPINKHYSQAPKQPSFPAL